MNDKNYLSIDSSILYRCSQKYFDKALDEYGLGYAHVLFLTLIYENEGISMNTLANLGSFDKGTITKSIAKLQDNDYVRIETSLDDKRRKLLYTTNKCNEIMPIIYKYKNNWSDYLCQDLSLEEFNSFINSFQKILVRCNDFNSIDDKNNDFKVFGLQKLTLLDYPGNMASTLFTGGCNFKCPFCHNKNLVFLDENINEISKDDIFEFLNKRSNVLDGVCISGGEPLINEGLIAFIKEIKNLGLKVKLDTNGYCFDKLKYIIDYKLVDYIAMDIKNTYSKYPLTTGIDDLDTDNIKNSIKILMNSNIEYEFRTTIVKEFHDEKDMYEIGEMLKGAKRYYLQNFNPSNNCISNDLHSHSKETLLHYLEIILEYIPNAIIRGLE